MNVKVASLSSSNEYDGGTDVHSSEEDDDNKLKDDEPSMDVDEEDGDDDLGEDEASMDVEVSSSDGLDGEGADAHTAMMVKDKVTVVLLLGEVVEGGEVMEGGKVMEGDEVVEKLSAIKAGLRNFAQRCLSWLLSTMNIIK